MRAVIVGVRRLVHCAERRQSAAANRVAVKRAAAAEKRAELFAVRARLVAD